MHQIILRCTHDKKLNGYITEVGCNDKGLVIPEFCGCTSSFAPAGYTETGEDGVVRDVWKQTGFKFNEYRAPL